MLVDLKTACSELGYNYEAVWRRYKRGELPCVKVGRTVAVETDRLQEALAALGVKQRQRGVKHTSPSISPSTAEGEDRKSTGK